MTKDGAQIQMPAAQLEAIHAQCERALRRLRLLAHERDDVLLGYAVTAVRRASMLSATPRA